jgi:GxxExxY protein
VDKIVTAVKSVYDVLGPGYHSKLYKAALKIEFNQHQIKYDDRVFVTVTAGGIQFDPMDIDYWLVENNLLMGVLTGDDKPRVYDIFRMRSYLERLNLTHGVIAYWGTKNLQIYGICVK